MNPRYVFFLAIVGLAIACNTSIAEKALLENPDWLVSSEKRSLLGFITECALKKDQILITQNDDGSFEFYGRLGIAPTWNGFPNSLTETEQRWVSSCVLARVNYFGIPVPFNLRTDKKSGLYTPVTEAEIDEFPYYEGAYFGNIFHSPQKKYVCQGDAPKKILVGKNRICSIPALDGKANVSACGFTIVGNCDDTSVYNRDNTAYNEIFNVWLKMH
jgi:hypothetical protein